MIGQLLHELLWGAVWAGIILLAGALILYFSTLIWAIIWTIRRENSR